jgi:4-amino-4-deoxy-L-arabinose transferase-like glycosyltransferase
METKKIIFVVFFLTLILRAGISLYFAGKNDTEFWEYGPLAENIIAGKGYSLFHIVEGTPQIEFDRNAATYPSAYMMPGYPMILALLFLLFGKTATAVFLFQSLVAALTAVLIFKLTLLIADRMTALVAAAIYIFLPEMIYTTVSVGPTALYHLFLLLVIYLLVKNEKNLSKSTVSVVPGLLFLALIYLRPAILTFVLILFAYLLFKRRYKQVIIVSLIIISGLTPWIIRNYIVFDKIIPLTTSAGLNAYRGHNPYYPGFWQDNEIAEKLNQIAPKSDFETKMNDLFMSYAIEQIKSHPLEEIKTSFEKLFHLWIYYPYDSRTAEKLYIIPWLLLLSFFFVSLFLKPDFEHKKYLYIYLLACSLNAAVFFALLRYQTLMKIAIIPIAANGIILVWNLYKDKK